MILLEGWISVEDRLPDTCDAVFVLDDPNPGWLYIGNYWDKKRGWTVVGDDEYEGEITVPTHWLPFTVKMPEK